MQRTYKTASYRGRQSRSMNSEPIRFDTKIVVLLRDDLEPWQRLNVTSFLVSGLGTQVPEVIGEPYEDADGVAYLPMPAACAGFRGDEGGPCGGTRQGAQPRAARHVHMRISSAPATTGTTGRRCGLSRRLDWMWWGWPCRASERGGRVVKGARMHP